MRGLAAVTVLGAATLVLAASAVHAQHGPVGGTPTALERLVWKGEPVYCGGPGKRVFALTFDDGPGPWTETLLAALRRGHAPATFFLVGDRIGLWPGAARAEAAYGAVGDHTWSHAHLLRLQPSAVRRELRWTQATIRSRTGATALLFRPPYEQSDGHVEAIAQSLGLLDVRWNIDSGDSLPGARPRRVAREIVANLKPGAIVLLHDTHPWTGEVVRRVLAAARRRHLWPVTVPRLLEVDPPSRTVSCYA